MQTYTIWAHSPSLNQSHRQFDLSQMNQAVTDPQQAQRLADAFASQYNRDQKQHTTDWQGQIRWEELGIQTVPGYRR